MIRRLAILLVVALFVCALASADEGMWLYNAFPSAKIKAKYGFAPDQAWLDHVRQGSVRFNNGGSGSFVSDDGLAFTNHHVGADCIQSLSTGGKDFMKAGFYARTRAEEAKCPDLELNVLMGIEDVTAKVSADVKPGMSDADAGKAQRSAMSAIEKECTTVTGMRCDVVTLYSGGMYHLYKYKKYTDVRLVFAPEFDAAFFGGDPDNFEYPRYDLDICFFRIYENDKPVHLDNYLRWAKDGIKEGDLIFVSGHPGNTGRLLTMSQLEYLRDVQYPWAMKWYAHRIQVLQKFADQSAENMRTAKEDIFGISNSLKAYTGYQSGLLDKDLMDQKAAEERRMVAAVNSDPKRKEEFGDPWTEVATAEETARRVFFPMTYVEKRGGFRGDLCNFSRILVRVTAELQKPNGERLREYRDSGLPSLQQELFSTAPVYKSLETVILGESLAEMRDNLGADNEVVKRALQGKTPEEAAKTYIEGTKLDDVAVRKQLYDGGAAAVAASTDPLIVLLRDIDPEARKYRKIYDDEVDAVVRRTGAKLAKIRFVESGTDMPPDATFTLRLSYGVVKGYDLNGVHVPWFTTMGGAFEHAAKHDNKAPYELPKSWFDAKPKLSLKTPFNVVSTPDIIGGNSGSPVINKKGEVVGIVFDGNIESLPWNFAYTDSVARTVQVDSRGIQESLRKIYDAAPLANELLNGSAGK